MYEKNNRVEIDAFYETSPIGPKTLLRPASAHEVLVLHS